MFTSKRSNFYLVPKDCGNVALRLTMPKQVFNLLQKNARINMVTVIAALRAMYPEVEMTLVESKWITEYIGGMAIQNIKTYGGNIIVNITITPITNCDYLYGEHTLIELFYYKV